MKRTPTQPEKSVQSRLRAQLRPALALALLLALPACADLPLGFATLTGTAANATQRGAVEIEVKTNYPAILRDIGAGGGPALTAAFDVAFVPEQDRPTRLIQLDSDYGLYAANPDALTNALLVWGARGG